MPFRGERRSAGRAQLPLPICRLRARGHKEKLVKQLKECKDYDDRLGHIALARIPIDLDDGVKVNYDKVQTGADGKKQAILAKI